MLTQSNWLIYPAVFGAGLIIGLIYFGGLWWTLQRLLRVGNVAVWLAASFIVRMGLTLGLFFGVANGRFDRLFVAIAGFFTMRFISIAIWKPKAQPPTKAQETTRAERTTEA